MDTSNLLPGDHIEANVKGVSFKATVLRMTPDRLLLIEPDDPKRYTWRCLTARQVVKKIEAQARLEASA